ncbi:MAG: YDG domain-containing protein, partial [Verrucomicrobiota bacterium]
MAEGLRARLGRIAFFAGMLALVAGRATASSDAYAWGWNGLGQLGNGTTGDALAAVTVVQGARPSGVQWVRVAAGGAHGLALGTDGRAYAWGGNGSGQLGVGTTDPGSRAALVSRGAVPLGVLLTAISAGGQHSVALGSDGKLYAWGENEHGQLGDGTTTDRTEPVEVLAGAIPAGVQVTAVSAGWEHTVALGSDGRAYAWGRNGSGQLGDGSYFGSVEPVVVASGTVTFSQVAAGRFHTLALGSDGLMRAWGGNGSGQLGDGSLEDRPTPDLVSPGAMPDGATVVAIASGWSHGLALTGAGRVYAWGANGSGQVGDGTVEDRLTPVEVTGFGEGASIGKIAANGLFSVASGSGGTLYGWGANDFGQLGDGTTVGRLQATAAARGAVRSGLEVEDLAAGAAHVLVLADGPPPLEVPVVYGGRVEGEYGSAVSGSVQAEGSAIVEYGAVGLPVGLSVDPSTGAVSGVAGQVGTFTVTVTARNAAGAGSGLMTVVLGSRAVSVTGLAVQAREYDGTTSATLTGTPTLAGVLDGDDVTLGGTGTATFTDANAGTGKAVVVGGYTLG